MTDNRLTSPSAERNRGPILEILRQHLPAKGVVLEIASGSGQHVVHFAHAFPGLTFQPSDPDPTARKSIGAWIAHEDLANVRAPITLDVVADETFPEADTIICINMIHISPWPATLGLLRKAAKALAANGLLFLYGPYKRNGVHTAPSNAAFDARLRSEDPAWGVRDLETVIEEAAKVGLNLAAITEMPANNLSVVFRR